MAFTIEPMDTEEVVSSKEVITTVAGDTASVVVDPADQTTPVATVVEVADVLDANDNVLAQTRVIVSESSVSDDSVVDAEVVESTPRESEPREGKDAEAEKDNDAEANAEAGEAAENKETDQKVLDVHRALQDPAVVSALLALVASQEAKTKEKGKDNANSAKAAPASGTTVTAQAAEDAPMATQTVSAGKALADGAMSLLGGAGQLLGGAGALLGIGMKRGADTLSASLTKAGDRSLGAGGAKVNPILSEYRVNHAQKAADDYRSAQEAMWSSGKMPDVRKAIEERAAAMGLSVPDVVEKMKPNGELKDLHEKYMAALTESPEASGARKTMDKSLSSWARSYNAGMQEAADPDTPTALKEALGKSKTQMEDSVKGAPSVGDAPSDNDKFTELVERIMERVREFIENMKGFFGGSDRDHGPA